MGPYIFFYFFCEGSKNSIYMNSVVETRAFTEQDADPILGDNAIHWLICIETYNANRAPTLGQNQDWFIGYQDEETCVYHKLDDEGYVIQYTIIGFRGTKVLKDIKDDIKLADAARGTDDFPRAKQGVEFTRKYVEDNPELSIQVTGHSLGGAIARVTGQQLGIGIITFNAAAPPSNPVTTGPNEIDYHIVFDIISAWQHPNTVRIDKGYRPIKTRGIIPLKWAGKALKEMAEAHKLDCFSNQKSGIVVPGHVENQMFKSWFYSLPLVLRTFMTFYLLGASLRIKLPDIQ
jgi:hypothetical protein